MGTELAREASVEIFHQLGLIDDVGNLLPEFAASMKTIPQGAATTIWCATSPLLNNTGGVYCEDADIALLSTEQVISAGVKPYSLDENSAKHLWILSEKMIGISFNVD
jgi:hypothetical protein